jgi:FAD/FMN-containing dehydrogenase
VLADVGGADVATFWLMLARAGCVQVGAHGTGANIPPVDEQVIAFKLVTPGMGTIEVTRASDPHLFDMARVGLGALGVIAEVTLQCVPAGSIFGSFPFAR